MLFLAALLLSAPACAPAAPKVEGPFVELSFDAALAEAKRAKKLVMIDFFTTWCGPCKRLDRITWKDPKVIEWLGEKCVALKVDAERDVDLARRFRITAYPTMVFIDGSGKEINRLRGFLDGEQFLGAVKNMKTAKAEPAVAKPPPVDSARDPIARASSGRALLGQQKYDEALVEFLWCWDQGVQASPAFALARRSILLADIATICKTHAPALNAFRDRRDAAESRAKGGSNSAEDVIDACALSRAISQASRGVDLYDTLRTKEGGLSAPLRDAFASEILDLLGGARRYMDIVELVEDPAQFVRHSLARSVQVEALQGTTEPPAGLMAKASFDSKRTYVVRRLTPVLVALLAGGRRTEAIEVAQQFLEYANVEEAYTDLVTAVEGAGDVALARSLAEQGLAALPKGSSRLLRSKYEKLPSAK